MADTQKQERMLTTVDNPISPFDDLPAWHAYDVALGYNTLALLARVTITSPNLSEADQDLAIQLAIEEIAHHNVSGMHRLVTADDYKDNTGSVAS